MIGDHPVDTYTGTDLQAYVEVIKYWPANAKDRDANKTPREIIASNRDMRLLPLAHKTLVQGYVAIVKTVITSGQTNYNYPNPIANLKLSYPDTARPSVSAEPLSPEKINQLFITGVESGFLDNAMLPLWLTSQADDLVCWCISKVQISVRNSKTSGSLKRMVSFN